LEAITNEQILARLKEQFPEAIRSHAESYGMLTVVCNREKYLDVLRFLRDDAVLQFNFLTDACGAHYPNREEQFEMIYHLHSWSNNVRIRVKVPIAGEHPHIATASKDFPTTNWMERETYDFYGIHFDGHPNLKRILNVDDMAIFPMRKEYPLEDNTRTDKDDKMFGR